MSGICLNYGSGKVMLSRSSCGKTIDYTKTMKLDEHEEKPEYFEGTKKEMLHTLGL